MPHCAPVWSLEQACRAHPGNHQCLATCCGEHPTHPSSCFRARLRADLDGILGTINGRPCSIDCTPDGTCTMDIQGFFVTLTAPCAVASCVVPGFTFVQGALGRAPVSARACSQ